MMQVTVKTLRHYEQKGLLVPDEVDEWTGYRYYSITQMQRLNTIRGLQRQGFSLEEIKDLFEDESQMPSVAQLTKKIEETERQLQILMERRHQLLKWMDSHKQIRTMENLVFNLCPKSLWQVTEKSFLTIVHWDNFASIKLVLRCNDWGVNVPLQVTALQ